MDCKSCKSHFLMKDGRLGTPRPPDRPPDCSRCPKMLYTEIWEDSRILQSIIYNRLGLSIEDDIIRADSWLYAALGIIRSHENQMDMARIEAETRAAKSRMRR